MAGRRPVSALDPVVLAETLGGVRTLAAACILAAPALSARVLGADRATARRVTWLTRMMGVRDGAIGVGTVAATRSGRGAGAWLVAGGVSDAVDAAALLAAVRAGRVRGFLPGAVIAIAGGSALAHGVAALRSRE